MGLLLLGVIGFWLFAGNLGARSRFFEEQITKFELGTNGAWEYAQVMRSNGDPPEQYKSKIKKAEKAEKGGAA